MLARSIGGFDRVYEIGRIIRNEGISRILISWHVRPLKKHNDDISTTIDKIICILVENLHYFLER